jgi:DNA-binding MarR family transcriptional regulator
MPPEQKSPRGKRNISPRSGTEATLESMSRAVSEVGWVVPNLDYPTFRLMLVNKIIDRLITRQLKMVADLTYPEWRTLSRLYSSEGLTVRQVAELAWADRAEVSRAAMSLEERGLTARIDNPKDRRAPILFLTPAGKALYDRTIVARGRFHQALLAKLSDAEKKQLDRTLKKIAGALATLPDDLGLDFNAEDK